MANPTNKAFFEQYAQMAIEQQQKYGIPASVTLAQCAIESSWGKSACALEDKNMFGIHATRSWVDAGKPYTERNDMGMVKFCVYGDVGESFEHHSRFLLENQRYKDCFNYASDDHRAWAYGICAAGYAYRPANDPDRYARTIETIIRQNGLEQYDQQAITDAQFKGIAIGYAKGLPPSVGRNTTQDYCFPLAGERLVMSDGYGMDPTGYRTHTHNGIDLKASYQDVLATESQGRVVKVGYDNGSGNYAVVEYGRSDGAKWRVSYGHLDRVDVRQGDTVQAGQKIGVSGNTGNSTGPHLHLTVKHQKAGMDTFKTVNPLDYLAEIAVRGQLTATVQKKGTGEELLASRKGRVGTTPTPIEELAMQRLVPQQQQNALAGAQLARQTGSSNPESLLAYLMGQNHDGQYAEGRDDLFTGLISGLFSSVIGMAVMLDQVGNERDGGIGQGQQCEQEVQEKTTSLIERRRESVDPQHARETAMMNFDTVYPEQQQNTGQRLV